MPPTMRAEPDRGTTRDGGTLAADRSWVSRCPRAHVPPQTARPHGGRGGIAGRASEAGSGPDGAVVHEPGPAPLPGRRLAVGSGRATSRRSGEAVGERRREDPTMAVASLVA